KLAALTPEQRALLDLKLKQKGLQYPHEKLERKQRNHLDSLPLSYGQERLWVLHQLQPEVPFYNEVGCWKIAGDLNAIALEQSLAEIIQRHETLRTKFVTEAERPIQIILPIPEFKLEIIDLSDRSDLVLEIIQAETQKSFDLSQGYLYRIQLLHISPNEHILLVVLHHIICDGWSMGVFIQELAKLYLNFSHQKASPLPTIKLQYADYAIWQRQRLSESVLQTQLDYWKQQLSGNLPILELPSFRSRQLQVDSWRGKTKSARLSPELTQKLKAIAQHEGATLYMTLLAAFKTLLYRYTGLTDILVGSPIANRDRPQLEGLIGLFLNTLVLRTDLSGNPSFQQLLKRVRKVALEAYRHQDLPFEKLVDELQPERNLSQSPLFQVMFILQNSPISALELPDLKVSPIPVDNGTAIFDLTFNLQEVNGGLQVDCEYNADLLDDSTISNLLDNWETLLRGIVANPQTRISELPLVNPHRGAMHCTRTTLKEQQFVSVVDLFELRVKEAPEAIAVVFEEEKLTYQELDEKANLLAESLRSLGVKPEILVGICLEPSLELITAVLGVLKAGGAYLPLDPAYPPERLGFMLQDSSASVLITQNRWLPTPPHHSAQIICLDADGAENTRRMEFAAIQPKSACADYFQPAKAGFVCIAPDFQSEGNLSTLAYIIYTSGSTSQPKGVMVTHGSWLNAYLGWEEAYGLREKPSSHLQMASFSFDVFAGNLVRALCSGGKLILCPKETLLEPAKLYQLMVREKVDRAEFIPSVLRHLVKYLVETGKSLDFMRSLIVGSDSWYVSEHLHLQQFCGEQTDLINSYGVTEATIDTTYFPTPDTDLAVDRLVPIGYPFPNSEVYVLDSYLQPVPTGVTGELYIGGAGLARGYYQRPDLTAEKFIPHPYSNGDRLYRTGDLVRYLPDGNLEYLGRIDNQAKIRGMRIELAEVEAAIQEYSSIKTAVAVVREDIPGDKRLVAYITPHCQLEELRRYLKQKLPSHLIPSSFVFLDSFPITPNGKIDRRALPIPDTSRPEVSASFAPPKTEIEIKLAEIWAEVLNLQQIGRYDNFFELGGDSILAIGAIAKANQQGLHLTPRQLFQSQTIAELANEVTTIPQTITEQGVVTGSVPLTPIQHWFFQQEFQEMHHWNQSVWLEVKPDIDAQILAEAFKAILIHHDALRMQFTQQNGTWKQVCLAPSDLVPCLQFDLSRLSESEQELEMDILAKQLQASLDLEFGLLVKVAFFHLGSHKPSNLCIAIHHLVVDGVSWRILLEDWQTAYQQLSQKQAIALPPKTTSFKQWAEKLLTYATLPQIQSEKDFWLSNFYPSHIPIDFPQKEYQTQNPKSSSVGDSLPSGIAARSAIQNPKSNNTVADSQTITVKLSATETQALLQDVPAAYRTQIEEVLLTALVQAFGEWTGRSRLLIDLEGHGRQEIDEEVDISRTVGWFTTVFPVSLNLEGLREPEDALPTIKEQMRAIPQHGFNYGVWRYLTENPEHFASASPVGAGLESSFKTFPTPHTPHPTPCSPEVSFNYLGQLDRSFAKDAVFNLLADKDSLTYSPQSHRPYLLEIDAHIAAGELKALWTYSRNLHHRHTIEHLAQNFIKKLRSLIHHCQSPDAGGYTPSDFPLAQMDFEELNSVLAQVG
ncbi:non-ribosomal peptide synthetase, partial [Merismopedia glauca]